MSQKIINVGTVANDGTGDTIRGAFTNVNANFTEVYANITTLTAGLASIDNGQNTAIAAAYNTTNAAYGQANTSNTMLYNLAISANGYADLVGAAANAYSVTIGASGNSRSTTLATAGNSYSESIGTAGNSYMTSVATSGNSYAEYIGTSGNAYSSSLATAGNNYVSVLVANNSVGSNDWSNTVGTAGNNWTQTTFATLSNTAIVYNTVNASFGKANSALPNTTGTFAGDLTIAGSVITTSFFNDPIGPVREKLVVILNANHTLNVSQVIIIANNTSAIDIKIPDDNQFLFTANVGTKIDIHQYNTGTTRIKANDAAVTIVSSNNWANIAGQYLEASIVKVKANTWILSGNLKV